MSKAVEVLEERHLGLLQDETPVDISVGTKDRPILGITTKFNKNLTSKPSKDSSSTIEEGLSGAGRLFATYSFDYNNSPSCYDALSKSSEPESAGLVEVTQKQRQIQNHYQSQHSPSHSLESSLAQSSNPNTTFFNRNLPANGGSTVAKDNRLKSFGRNLPAASSAARNNSINNSTTQFSNQKNGLFNDHHYHRRCHEYDTTHADYQNLSLNTAKGTNNNDVFTCAGSNIATHPSTESRPSVMSGFRTVGSGKSITISNEQMAKATKILGVNNQEGAGMGCNGSNVEKSDVSYRKQGRVESVLDTNTSGRVGTGFHRHYRDNTNNAIHHNSSPPNKAKSDRNDDAFACAGSNIATHPSTESRPSVMSGFRTVGSGKSIAISNEQMAKATKILGVDNQEDIGLRVINGFHDELRSLESLGSMDSSKDKDIILSDIQGPSSCKTSFYYKNAELRAGKRIQSSQVLPIVTPASLASNDFNNRERVVTSTASSPRERLRHTPIHEMATIVHDSLQSAMKSKRLFGSTVKARNEKSIKYSKVALSQIGANNHATKVSTWASCIEHGVNDVTMRVTSVNAIKLRFNIHDNMPLFFFGQRDPPKCTNVGKITDILDWLCCQGCDKTLVTEKWIKNHYRWIVWKLAAMERRFPEQLGGQYLTFNHVLSQIKGRYEKELCRANRPAVRKILNRDVSPCVPIILCVSQILRFKSNTPQNGGDQCAGKEGIEEIRLEASDGWYALSAMLDGNLSNLVNSGKIRVGSKLVICNAQLVGSEDGIDPLDDDYHSDRRSCRLVLQITANNTRLARWDAKLGFVHPKYTAQQGGSILIKNLSGIFPDGGTLPAIDLVICKRYPRMFLEQVKVDNRILSNHLSEADEAARQNDHDINHQRASEKYADIAGTECSEVRILYS